nr:NADP-dependent phosphogluconate dehydrogenase [bacterium]
LGAYDSLRTARLDAASFNQMLRDTFGDHTFTRFDEDGTWTCDWDGDGTIRRLE